MLARILAVATLTGAILAPFTASADDVVKGVIGGAIVGAAVATGALPYEHREPLREYVVRENHPSYRHEREQEVVVGREMPRGEYESYDVPERYGVREHRYAIINNRPVVYHRETRRIVHVYE